MLTKTQTENEKGLQKEISMKELLITMLKVAGPEMLVTYLKKNMKEATKFAMTDENHENAKIPALESDFYTALLERDADSAKTALRKLFGAYVEHGLPATQESSGKYQALNFLLTLEEFIDAISVHNTASA